MNAASYHPEQPVRTRIVDVNLALLFEVSVLHSIRREGTEGEGWHGEVLQLRSNLES